MSRSVVMVSYTHFSPKTSAGCHPDLRLEVEGRLDRVVLEARMVRKEGGGTDEEFVRDETVINGLDGWVGESHMADISSGKEEEAGGGSGKVVLGLGRMTPGSLVVVAISPLASHQAAIAGLQQLDMGRLEEVRFYHHGCYHPHHHG